MAGSDTEELLTVEQIARMMQVHPRTIRNRIHTGLLPACKMAGGKDWRVRRGDADALLRQQTPRSTEVGSTHALIDRLNDDPGRARAVAALRALRERDPDEQRATLAVLEQTAPLSLRAWEAAKPGNDAE